MSATNSFSVQRLLYDIKLHKIILFSLAILLYANTLGHEFVLDDGIVITENKFVKNGISGIPDLLNKDSFYGFFKKQGKEKLVSGGRYRPMSMIAFALIYQVFGPVSFVFHLFSIISYAFLGILIYMLLKHLFKPLLKDLSVPFAFFSALLFISHPIHTECVANIKGMDEVCALLFSIIAFYVSLLYYDTQKNQYLIYSTVLFLMGLLSKENAIAYLAIIPAAIYFIYGKELDRVLKITAILFAATLIFIFMRSSVLGFNPFSGVSTELMNNPYLKLENGVNHAMKAGEKAGMITYTLFEYIRLLLFPHPLTHDYYPKQIPTLGLFSFKSIIAILMYSAMIIYALFKFKNKPVFSISIISYLFPLFLVSNILFPVGTNMAERFLFMPSIGFVVLISYLLLQQKNLSTEKAFYVIGVIVVLYSIKTITRNPVWHDNLTLFTSDLKTSANSAKIHNGIAGVTMEKLPGLKDSAEIHKITTKARAELEKAIAIHPLYLEAQLQLGNINYYEKNYDAAIEKYNIVLSNLPEDEDAFKNLQMSLREKGWQLGQSGNVPLAKQYLSKALGMNPKDPQAIMLMGIAEGSAGNYNDAAGYFYKVISIDPKNAQAYYNLGITYKNLGDEVRSDSNFKQSMLIDPSIYEKNGGRTK